jgi:hypothetical protein
MRKPTQRVADAFSVAVEVCGSSLTDAAVRVICSELAAYDEREVLIALARCCREVRGRLTLADIVERIDDGRPGANEAWGIVGTDDESRSFIATEDAMEALAAARPLIVAGDMVAARMAFLDSYRDIVAKARAQRKPVKWVPSLGHDASGRSAVLAEVAKMGRIGSAAGLNHGGQEVGTNHNVQPALNAILERKPIPTLAPPSAERMLPRDSCSAAWCDGQWHYDGDPSEIRHPAVSRCDAGRSA